MEVGAADNVQRNSSYFCNQSLFGDSCGDYLRHRFTCCMPLRGFQDSNLGPCAAVACTTGTVSKAVQLSKPS
jgi:hypothetical protein